jgi:hypothetical protein
VFNIEHLGATFFRPEPFLSQIVGEGPMTNRSSTGLAALDQNGSVSLTIDGQQRLRAALAAQASR